MNLRNNLATQFRLCAFKQNGGHLPDDRSFLLKTFYKYQKRLSRFTLGLLGLAFCVFLWGLQYKLSLYDPPQAVSHKLPTAKLLSKNEQATASEGAAITKSSATDEGIRLALICVALPFLAAFAIVSRPAPLRRKPETGRPRRRRPDPSLNVFSFRPPPIPAFIPLRIQTS